MHGVSYARAQLYDVPRQEARTKINSAAEAGVAREDEAGPRTRWAAYILLFSRCASELLLTLFRPVIYAESTFKLACNTRQLLKGTRVHTIKGEKTGNSWITVKVVATGEPIKVRTTELALVEDNITALYSPRASKRPRLNSSRVDKHDFNCFVCNDGGNLLMCEGDGCSHVCHLDCLDPPLREVPEGDWYCPECRK